MPTSSLSMFHRRLIILGGLLSAGLIAPAWQLSRWTVSRHEEKMAEAEAYLVSWQWLPTNRGRILDREGRVLAEDRPSFNVSVQYNVITGDWAYAQAYRRAKRLNRELFPTLNRAQRRELAETYQPDFDERLDRMWNELARLGGISRTEMDERLDDIKRRVQSMASAYRKRQLTKLENDAADAGVDSNVAAADLDRPIAEEQMSHIVLRDVDDQTAFIIIRATLDPEADADSVAGSGGGAGSGKSDGVATMPGVSVIYAGTRDYPNSSRVVTIDCSSFPASLRSAVPVSIPVDGVATHMVGWMRHRIFREDNAELPATLSDGSPSGAYYLDNEAIGSAGMERAAERTLRGVRGVRTTKLDTREQFERAPIPGRDVRLTVDIELQATIQALLSPEAGLTRVQPWHTTRNAESEELPNGVPTLNEPLAGAVLAVYE